MAKSIELKLPEWANWIAQDYDRSIYVYEYEPSATTAGDFYCIEGKHDNLRLCQYKLPLSNWRDSKINLNTDSCYIDENGVLRKVDNLEHLK